MQCLSSERNMSRESSVNSINSVSNGSSVSSDSSVSSFCRKSNGSTESGESSISSECSVSSVNSVSWLGGGATFISVGSFSRKCQQQLHFKTCFSLPLTQFQKSTFLGFTFGQRVKPSNIKRQIALLAFVIFSI